MNVETSRARIAASILDADLGNLAHAVGRVEREGADRIHLDIMDGHFVPNLTFGANTVKALRKRTRIPFDAHLMISEPGRYVAEYVDAGCDSITFHVEVHEPIEPTLRAIKAAGRAAGLAVRPGTPLAALEPYQELLDIVLVMTVEPGFGGQSFLKETATAKIPAARALLRHKVHGGEVHVDGGVNRETAETVGGLGADILVVGSALWVKGRDMAREIRLLRALADEGYQYDMNDGVPPIPRDRMVTFATLPRHLAMELEREIEDGGIPCLRFRAGIPNDAAIDPDDELLIPATVEPHAEALFAQRRTALQAEAEAWKGAGRPVPTGDPAHADGRYRPASRRPARRP